MTIFLGLDPGQSGAVCAVDARGRYISELRFDKATMADVRDYVLRYSEEAFAMLENVHAFPGRQGVVSTFKFGRHFGMLEGILTCVEIPFEYVSPQKWQKEMKCLSKGDKNVTKAAAQRIFPRVTIVHANADSLLLAEYGRRTHRRR